MSTLPPSSSSQEPSFSGPLDFKINHPTQKYARRLHFSSPPTYSILSSKILSLWPSPSLTSHSLALDYVDREGDRVLLSSDEELQAFYHELRSGAKGNEVGVVKMRVVVLEGKKQEEAIKGGGGGSGKKVELPPSTDSFDLASYNVAGGLPCPAWPKSIAEKKSEEENDRGEDDIPALLPVGANTQPNLAHRDAQFRQQTSSSSSSFDDIPALVEVHKIGRRKRGDQLASKEVQLPDVVVESTPAASVPTPIHVEPTTSAPLPPSPPSLLADLTEAFPPIPFCTISPDCTASMKRLAQGHYSHPAPPVQPTVVESELVASPPSPSTASLLADLTEAFNLFTTSPAFTTILDRVAQGHYSHSPPTVQQAVVEIEPVASNTEEPVVAAETPAAAVPAETEQALSPSEPKRGPSIVEICQAEVSKGMGEAKKVLEEAGSVVGGMTSSFTSGIKELLVLRQTRDVREKELREAAAAEKEKEVVVVVEKSQPETVAVAVESDLETAAPAPSEYSPDKEVESLLGLVAAREEPTAKFGERSVVGRGGLPLPQTPPGRGFARFYGGQPTPQQSSSPPSYQDTGSFMAKRDEKEKEKGGE